MIKSPIIKSATIPEQWMIPELPDMEQIAVVREKARKYDELLLLLKENEKRYEHRIELTKSFIPKTMDNPIDFYNKGTLLGYEDARSDIQLLLEFCNK